MERAMDINEFEKLIDCAHITSDGETVFFAGYSHKDQKRIDKILKDNQIDNLSLTDFNELITRYQPQYLERKREKEKKIEQFSKMSTQEVANLSLEQKLDYIEILFPSYQNMDQLKEICQNNQENLRACLFNIDFPKSFWINEKKSTDRYVSLIASQPEIIDKIKNWQETSLDDKKFVIQQSAKIFKYIYGVAPEIAYFTPEEERSRIRAMGGDEKAHINAAYFSKGKIHFNEERLQNSDNFFAVSVLFHEGTHLRQHHNNFNNPLVERIFDSNLTHINAYEMLSNDKDAKNYKDLYTMQPAEAHAYGLQEYFEQRFTERTGIEKNHYTDLTKTTKTIHNKGFSFAKLLQYRSNQHD